MNEYTLMKKIDKEMISDYIFGLIITILFTLILLMPKLVLSKDMYIFYISN